MAKAFLWFNDTKVNAKKIKAMKCRRGGRLAAAILYVVTATPLAFVISHFEPSGLLHGVYVEQAVRSIDRPSVN